MRQKLLSQGAKKLEYEIRNIVKKVEQLQKCGFPVHMENIGDPIQKNARVPGWIKEIIQDLLQKDTSYGYCHSKGEIKTRQFLADKNNALEGVQITAEDILFFNGLGDAIAKLYQFLRTSSRIIGPSPAYSTHSSSEAAHANSDPITYRLIPENNWYPDLEELHNKVKYNPNVAGILIINPDNPTGMVYPPEYLHKIAAIAKEYKLLLISDEIYFNIKYNNVETLPLTQFAGDIPAIALKGISKEIPWPGARCGWMEFYNRHNDTDFDHFCNALEDSKMVEVCSTTLPQQAIPLIMSNPKYQDYLTAKNNNIATRGELIASIFSDIPEVTVNRTNGAFYNTIVFKEDAFKNAIKKEALKTGNPQKDQLLQEWVQGNMPEDKQFVYFLLASQGVCVVPLSSFHSELRGFRITLLEENAELLEQIFQKIKTAIIAYCRP